MSRLLHTESDEASPCSPEPVPQNVSESVPQSPFCPLLPPGKAPPPRFFYNGVGYCSLSEAACAHLLQLFVSDFRIALGRTFQVPLGTGRFADFYHRGYLIEYHEVRLFADGRSYGDFRSRDDYNHFIRSYKQVRHQPWRRERLLQETTDRLREHYVRRRRHAIDANPRFHGAPLLVAGSVAEFYYSVVRRFQSAGVPACEEFHELFYSLVREVARENSPRARRRRKVGQRVAA